MKAAATFTRCTWNVGAKNAIIITKRLRILVCPAVAARACSPTTSLIMDASYIRLKNAEVGYTLPESISKKIGASNVRFYLSGNNLYTWTHLKTDSFDPEQNSPAAYPTMRTYNVGLNITF